VKLHKNRSPGVRDGLVGYPVTAFIAELIGRH
jgi:hypothetical protein